jgi:NADPH-dependent glutamate synthase beta subunit-like oxidoreductase
MASTGHKVAVVGAGPAGLTAAFYLSLFGHEVTIFESHSDAGGMLRFALPEYRLPKTVLDKEVELIRRLGVHFVFNKVVGTDVSLNDLQAQFDVVFLSIGTWKETRVSLPGSELKGVMPALLFLEGVAKNQPVALGQRVVIIGGGNAAVDSARTALRKGATVTVIYRRQRKDMPAIREEVEAAEQEGAHFVFLAAPHRIVGENGAVKAIEVVKTRLGEFDISGRRRPIPTEEIQSFKCDTVILAVGEAVDRDFCQASGLKLTEHGTLEFDRYTLETNRDKFYAGGDVISGAANVSNAMGYGKKAARFIDQRLMGEIRTQEFLPHFEYDQAPPAPPSPCGRHHPHPLPPKVRVKTFQEAVLPLTPEEAFEEAGRCLRCDVKDSG